MHRVIPIDPSVQRNTQAAPVEWQYFRTAMTPFANLREITTEARLIQASGECNDVVEFHGASGMASRRMDTACLECGGGDFSGLPRLFAHGRDPQRNVHDSSNVTTAAPSPQPWAGIDPTLSVCTTRSAMSGSTSKTVCKNHCRKAGSRTSKRPANFVACVEVLGTILLRNCDPLDVVASNRTFRGTTEESG